MSESPYALWDETLVALQEADGPILLLGGTDVGKTTFARQLVNGLVEQGRPTALLDGDLGQSEVGPPTCLGLAYLDAPVVALSDLPPHALAFVGSTSPPGYLPEYLTAFRTLADQAEGRLLVVDTCGYIQGGEARRLAHLLFELLSPKQVVALQRRGELEALLAPIRRRDGCVLHTPPIPPVIGKKPAQYRAQRRAMRFASYFQNAPVYTYSLDEVALTGTWLGSGTPVAAHLLKFLNQTLAPTRVFYAEKADTHLGLMLNQSLPSDAPALGLALEQLRAREVSLTVAPRWKHLLIGLEGGNGKLLGLGLLEALDFRRRTLGVLTPVRAPAAARVLHLGSLRVKPDGTELGVLRFHER